MTQPQHRRRKETVYLCLGSNLGDRGRNIQLAEEMLSKQSKLELFSPLYDTAPVGNTNQPRFINRVVKVTTGLTPVDLLVFVKNIERGLGRKPAPTGSPRPIDIDILLYDDTVVRTPDLVIPHPRLAERVFVLAPLVDIAPDVKHPLLGKTMKQLLAEVPRAKGDAVKYVPGGKNV